MLQLSGQYYYNYTLDDTGPADYLDQTPDTFGSHQMVIATASLNLKEDHQGVGAISAVGFTEYTQDGNVLGLSNMPGAFVGANVSNLRWGFIVVGSRAAASVTITTFD